MRKHDTAFGMRRKRLAAGLWALLAIVSPAFGADTAAQYAPAIETLADKLATRFVDPAAGRRYADMLRSKLSAGEYAGIDDAKVLARRLTQDLQAVAADGHLRVDLAPKVGDRAGPAAAGPRRVVGPAASGAPRQASALAPIDLPSVAETKWIADGVAYLRFNQFAGEPASVAAIRAFVQDHANAKAIIIDTRGLARGGGLAEMDALFPYLFAQETVLVEMSVAKNDGAARGPSPFAGPTLRTVAGPAHLLVRQHLAIPDPAERRLNQAKVFYLTSKRTRSAGEHFALALQRTHRGVLIGERTAGANHFGGIEPIGAGLAAFIPVGRTYDPDTGKDWEGTGIVPDIEVPADQALAKALALAGA
ncbi:S41 family peptidase [Lysobacter sp. cf310]|uniref:S41 family peptidase n=1 Tax=Lysobacter sp. cf310 TaxID=1761790 RepID=UPI0008F0CB8C|nr:S41 family peptidase [Lysobacter sp. cf310]SFK93330.1 N-terminal domain of Peptidase_S41 [Lysobacter sp. cf310]